MCFQKFVAYFIPHQSFFFLFYLPSARILHLSYCETMRCALADRLADTLLDKVSARVGEWQGKEFPPSHYLSRNMVNVLVHSGEHFVPAQLNKVLHTIGTNCFNALEQSVFYGVTKCFLWENTLFCVGKQKVPCGKTFVEQSLKLTFMLSNLTFMLSNLTFSHTNMLCFCENGV